MHYQEQLLRRGRANLKAIARRTRSQINRPRGKQTTREIERERDRSAKEEPCRKRKKKERSRRAQSGTDEDVSLRVDESKETTKRACVRACSCARFEKETEKAERERERGREPGAGGCIQVISGSDPDIRRRVFLDRALNCFG